MANLNETATWEAGIYQWETSDPVQGGPNGIDNKPTRQLANRTLWLKTELAKAVASIGKNKTDAENMFARKTTAVTAGAGLTGGGTLNGNVQFALGTPGTCSGNTTNWAGSDTHTHQLAAASPTVAGVAKLINNLTTDDANSALSAAMGKKLNEEKLGNSGNQTLLNGRFTVRTGNDSWAQIAAKSSGDGWIFEVGPEGEGQFTRRRQDAFATHTGNIAIYKLPAGGTGEHVLATESQIGFVKPVIKPATSEIIDLTKKSEILAYAGTSGNKHIQLTFYNNASSQIVGLPIEDKSPCQMDISIMGAYTVCRVYYFYLRREFVSSVNWNSEELSYRWDETVNKNTAVMLAGNQEIRGKKTFSESVDFAGGLRISGNNTEQWAELGYAASAVYLKNPASNKSLQLGDDGTIKYQGDKLVLWSDRRDAVDLANSQTVATSQAVKTVNDKAEQAAPPGAVAYFAGANPPPGWLKANGAAVSRTTYAALFAAIGTTYGAGDGRNTFNLPDLRGEFVRGLDDGRGIDSGRALGSRQIGTVVGADSQDGAATIGVAIAGIKSNYAQTAGSLGMDTVDMSDYSNARLVWSGGRQSGLQAANPDSNGHFSGVTRPRNIALLACIKI